MLSIVLRLCFLLFAVGCVCFWPAVSVAALAAQSQQPLVVKSASAVTVSPAPALAWQRLVAVICASLLLLFVQLTWGLFCGFLSSWPIVTHYPSVVPRLGFLFGRLFRPGFESTWFGVLRRSCSLFSFAVCCLPSRFLSCVVLTALLEWRSSLALLSSALLGWTLLLALGRFVLLSLSAPLAV